jgi:hypothetical protein
MRLRSVLLAIPALAGSAIVVKSFTVPYAEFCDAAQYCFGNHLPTLLNDVDYKVSWLVIFPAAGVTVAVAAVASLMILTGPSARALATWALNCAAVINLGFFALLQHAYQGGRWGALLGLCGSTLIVAAGAAAAFTFPKRNLHNPLTVR